MTEWMDEAGAWGRHPSLGLRRPCVGGCLASLSCSLQKWAGAGAPAAHLHCLLLVHKAALCVGVRLVPGHGVCAWGVWRAHECAREGVDGNKSVDRL